MKERILFAPSVNSTELLRTLARYGVNSFNLRIVNAVDLAKLALMRSGISVTEEFLTKKEQPAVISNIIGEIGYFSISSFSDAENIATTLDSIRSLIQENEAIVIEEKLLQGEFIEKNKALISAYKKYISAVEFANQIDTVMLIRKAIEKARPFDAEFIIINEYPLSPLEEKLLSVVSNNSYKSISMVELFDAQNKPVSVKSYTSAYGASNEVESIIGTIFESNIPIDNCVIATASNAEYSQLFYDICNTYNIPVNFGSGVPISNAYPASVLKLINAWDTVGYNGIDALNDLIFCEAFNRDRLVELFDNEDARLDEVISIAGSLKLSFNGTENKRRLAEYKNTIASIPDKRAKRKAENNISAVETLSNEISKGPVYIIEKYSKVRTGFAGRIDQSAIKVISESINAYLRFADSSNISEIVPEILSKTVCSENSREGALFVTSIDGAASSMRENLFVCGLSASNFPGKANENYLALDDDYLLFGDADIVPISENKIRDKKAKFNNLITIANALNVNVYISYSNFNLADLKEANPSSVLFELYRKQNGENSTVDEFNNSLVQVGFFDKNVSPDRLIGKAYIDNKAIEHSKNVEKAEVNIDKKKYRFSPSAISNYLSCPRMFFLQNILGISQAETDDPMTTVAANDFGTLAHSMMELIANNPISKDEFLQKGEEMFDEFMKSRPSNQSYAVEMRKTEFMEAIETAYDTDEGNEVAIAEGWIEAEHPSGITLYGFPDRVEKLKDGTYIIADYKTGNTVKHKENDVVSCMQALLYAFMVEQNYGYTISSCEYRYMKKGVTVKCAYNDSVKKEVSNILDYFKNAIDNSMFEAECSDCKYCTFESICGKTVQESEEDE